MPGEMHPKGDVVAHFEIAAGWKGQGKKKDWEAGFKELLDQSNRV